MKSLCDLFRFSPEVDSRSESLRGCVLLIKTGSQLKRFDGPALLQGDKGAGLLAEVQGDIVGQVPLKNIELGGGHAVVVLVNPFTLWVHGVPHIKCAGKGNWGRSTEVLSYLQSAPRTCSVCDLVVDCKVEVGALYGLGGAIGILLLAAWFAPAQSLARLDQERERMEASVEPQVRDGVS